MYKEWYLGGFQLHPEEEHPMKMSMFFIDSTGIRIRNLSLSSAHTESLRYDCFLNLIAQYLKIYIYY